MHVTQTVPRRWPAGALLGVMLLLQGAEADGQTNGPPSGSAVSWGAQVLPYVHPLTRFMGIATGRAHSLALKQDGTVVGWGADGTNSGVYPDYGQSMVPDGLIGVVAIAAGDIYSLALKQDGTVVQCDGTGFGQLEVPSGLSNVVAIAAGLDHSLALRQDGSVVAWGDNELGQTNLPGGLTGVVAVASGLDHSLALKQDGTVVAWGSIYEGS